MSNMSESGFGAGMVTGGLIGLAAVTKSVVDAGAQHARASATVGRWSVALDRANQRAIRAERALARVLIDNRALAKKMKDIQFELDILRNA